MLFLLHAKKLTRFIGGSVFQTQIHTMKLFTPAFSKFISSIRPALLPGAFVALTALATSANADPTVTTGAATGIQPDGAVLNATVNPNGIPTGLRFEYGVDLKYGSVTVAQFVGSGTSDVPFGIPVSGLTPETTYHFRAVAVTSTASGAPAINGADQTFTTTALPPPPAPTVTTAAAVQIHPAGA